MTYVGGEYFRTMGIALRQGRAFDRSDQPVGSGTVIVGEAAAERRWPGQDPIGQRLYHSEERTGGFAVVGVVEDILVSDFRPGRARPDGLSAHGRSHVGGLARRASVVDPMESLRGE